MCYLKNFRIIVIHEGCCFVSFFLFLLLHIRLRDSELTALSTTDRQISWNENYTKK